MRQPVTYRLSIEVRSNAAPEVPCAAAVRAAVEAFKRLMVTVANYATRELLHSAACLLASIYIYLLPRPRGRPPGTETVISLEEIGHAYHTCASELDTRPKRPQVAKKLLVSDSTLYRRLRDEGLSFRGLAQSARPDLPTTY